MLIFRSEEGEIVCETRRLEVGRGLGQVKELQDPRRSFPVFDESGCYEVLLEDRRPHTARQTSNEAISLLAPGRFWLLPYFVYFSVVKANSFLVLFIFLSHSYLQLEQICHNQILYEMLSMYMNIDPYHFLSFEFAVISVPRRSDNCLLHYCPRILFLLLCTERRARKDLPENPTSL